MIVLYCMVVSFGLDDTVSCGSGKSPGLDENSERCRQSVVSVPSSGTVSDAGSRRSAGYRNGWPSAVDDTLACRAGCTPRAMAVRRIHLDLPSLRWRSGVPNASLRTWLAAAPAMMIIEPMATYCRIIARRSLLQFLRHHLGLGAKVLKIDRLAGPS